MKYRKKPVVIEAFQYDGDFINNDGNYYAPEWTETAYKLGILYYASHPKHEHEPSELFVKTLEGEMHVSVGDYIIKGVQGEFYPCKPDIFKETYEKVEDKKMVQSKIKCPVCGNEVEFFNISSGYISSLCRVVKNYSLKCSSCRLESRKAEVTYTILEDTTVEVNRIELDRLIEEWSSNKEEK